MTEGTPKDTGFSNRGFKLDRRKFLKLAGATIVAAAVAPEMVANAAADLDQALNNQPAAITSEQAHNAEYLQQTPETTAIFAEYALSDSERKAIENQPFPLYTVVDKANPLKNSPMQLDWNGQLMKGINQKSEFVLAGKKDQNVALSGSSIVDVAKNLAGKNEPGSIQLMFVRADRDGKTFSAPVIRLLSDTKIDLKVNGNLTESPIPKGTLIVPNPITKTFSLYLPPTESTRYPEITQVDKALNDLGVKGIPLKDGSTQTFAAPIGSLALIERDSQKNITAIITDRAAIQVAPQNAVLAPEASATVTPDTTISPIETPDGYHGFETYHDGRRIRLLTNLPPTFAKWDKGIFKQMLDAFNANVPKGGKKIEGDITAIVKDRAGKHDDVMVSSIVNLGMDFAKTKKEGIVNIWTVYVDPDYEKRFKDHPTKDAMIAGLFTDVFPYGMEMSTHNDQFTLSTFRNAAQVLQNNKIDLHSLFTVNR